MIYIRFNNACYGCEHRETTVDEQKFDDGDGPKTMSTIIRCKHDNVCKLYLEEKNKHLKEYCESDLELTKKLVKVHSNKDDVHETQTFHIVVNVPIDDITTKNKEDVILGIIKACEYHVFKQFDKMKGEF